MGAIEHLAETEARNRAEAYLAQLDAAAALVQRDVRHLDHGEDTKAAMDALDQARILPPDLRATVDRRRGELMGSHRHHFEDTPQAWGHTLTREDIEGMLPTAAKEDVIADPPLQPEELRDVSGGVADPPVTEAEMDLAKEPAPPDAADATRSPAPGPENTMFADVASGESTATGPEVEKGPDMRIFGRDPEARTLRDHLDQHDSLANRIAVRISDTGGYHLDPVRENIAKALVDVGWEDPRPAVGDGAGVAEMVVALDGKKYVAEDEFVGASRELRRERTANREMAEHAKQTLDAARRVVLENQALWRLLQPLGDGARLCLDTNAGAPYDMADISKAVAELEKLERLTVGPSTT